MNAYSDTINPFELRGMVRDPKRFIGRRRELDIIFSHLATMQNVAVVGERLIGKSSLLNQIVITGKDRLGADYDLFYMDMERVFSGAEFFERAIEVLKNGRDGLSEEPDHRDFEKSLRGKKVIFCLDEFEQTVFEPEFGPEFFNVLRSLAQTGDLALVIATKHKLQDLYRFETQLTSPFYNIFNILILGELTEEEAREMAKTPAQDAGCPFSDDEIDSIIRLAGTHPYKLNLACSILYEAKSDKKSLDTEIDWNDIRQRFEQKLENARPVVDAIPVGSTQEIQVEQSIPAAKKVNWAAALFILGCVFFFIGIQFSIPFSMSIAGLIFLAALWLMIKDLVGLARIMLTKDKLS